MRSAAARGPQFPFLSGQASLGRPCVFRDPSRRSGPRTGAGCSRPSPGGRREDRRHREGTLARRLPGEPRTPWPGCTAAEPAGAVGGSEQGLAGGQQESAPRVRPGPAGLPGNETAVVITKPGGGRRECWRQDPSERVRILALPLTGRVTLDGSPAVSEALTPHL